MTYRNRSIEASDMNLMGSELHSTWIHLAENLDSDLVRGNGSPPYLDQEMVLLEGMH